MALGCTLQALQLQVYNHRMSPLRLRRCLRPWPRDHESSSMPCQEYRRATLMLRGGWSACACPDPDTCTPRVHYCSQRARSSMRARSMPCHAAYGEGHGSPLMIRDGNSTRGWISADFKPDGCGCGSDISPVGGPAPAPAYCGCGCGFEIPPAGGPASVRKKKSQPNLLR